jgi:hypothetical protein
MRVNNTVGKKSVSIRAVVHRADGRKENRGLIAYWHRNPVLNFIVNAYIKTRDHIYGRSRPK